MILFSNLKYSGFGVINLLDGCTLSADDYLYPHTFSGFSDIDLALEIGVQPQVQSLDPFKTTH